LSKSKSFLNNYRNGPLENAIAAFQYYANNSVNEFLPQLKEIIIEKGGFIGEKWCEEFLRNLKLRTQSIELRHLHFHEEYIVEKDGKEYVKACLHQNVNRGEFLLVKEYELVLKGKNNKSELFLKDENEVFTNVKNAFLIRSNDISEKVKKGELLYKAVVR